MFHEILLTRLWQLRSEFRPQLRSFEEFAFQRVGKFSILNHHALCILALFSLSGV